jgi:hypothetical protein
MIKIAILYKIDVNVKFAAVVFVRPAWTQSRAGVVVRSKYEETEIGVPQEGPLSPILSNIMLNELDRELERRGHRFVRYADDLIQFGFINFSDYYRQVIA